MVPSNTVGDCVKGFDCCAAGGTVSSMMQSPPFTSPPPPSDSFAWSVGVPAFATPEATAAPPEQRKLYGTITPADLSQGMSELQSPVSFARYRAQTLRGSVS